MFSRPFFRRPLVPALLGLTALTSLSLAPLAAHAQTAQAVQKPILTTLHRFDGTYGASSAATPTLGTDGNFYGTTSGGGINDYGTVYKMTPAGQFTTLHKFHGTDGFFPNSGLVQDSNGAFYGTAGFGGRNNQGDYGLVFRITPQGQLTVVHEFNGMDGQTPDGPLLRAADGSFYGTTASGGSSNRGTVFHMTASGTVTTLHTFIGKSTGYNPRGALAFGADGAIYGTTYYGGHSNDGTVFRVTRDGQFFVVHNFTGADGSRPYKGIMAGADGTLYGTAPQGGLSNQGTAFKIVPGSAFTLLTVFDTNGYAPLCVLTLGADGSVYGTTSSGGTHGRGSVFTLSPVGIVKFLYKFHTGFDGRYPHGGVVFGSDGTLYGTTSTGGSKGFGTIYKLTLPQ